MKLPWPEQRRRAAPTLTPTLAPGPPPATTPAARSGCAAGHAVPQSRCRVAAGPRPRAARSAPTAPCRQPAEHWWAGYFALSRIPRKTTSHWPPPEPPTYSPDWPRAPAAPAFGIEGHRRSAPRPWPTDRRGRSSTALLPRHRRRAPGRPSPPRPAPRGRSPGRRRRHRNEPAAQPTGGCAQHRAGAASSYSRGKPAVDHYLVHGATCHLELMTGMRYREMSPRHPFQGQRVRTRNRAANSGQTLSTRPRLGGAFVMSWVCPHRSGFVCLPRRAPGRGVTSPRAIPLCRVLGPLRGALRR
jgi:hypothetical protein